jgi:hypothetical protein
MLGGITNIWLLGGALEKYRLKNLACWAISYSTCKDWMELTMLAWLIPFSKLSRTNREQNTSKMAVILSSLGEPAVKEIKLTGS